LKICANGSDVLLKCCLLVGLASVFNFLCRYFNIDATNGQIRTKRPLDYENATSHIVQVTAYDAAADSRSVTVSVHVMVEDVEDMIPMFKEQLYVASVPENEVNYLVTKVEVRH